MRPFEFCTIKYTLELCNALRKRTSDFERVIISHNINFGCEKSNHGHMEKLSQSMEHS